MGRLLFSKTFSCSDSLGSVSSTQFFLLEAVDAMVTENHEIPSGWPLGLGIMNMRLRVLQRFPASAAAEPYSLHVASTSFSSFSSSNLDTESTASFFQDHSVSLGRLIGIRPGERSGFYLQNSINFEEHNMLPARDANTDVSRHRLEMSRGICIPLLLGALVKMSRSKSKSRK